MMSGWSWKTVFMIGAGVIVGSVALGLVAKIL